MILDAGPLIAVDRGEAEVSAVVNQAVARGEPLRTSAPVVAQVLRSPPQQVRLVRFLRSVDVHPFEHADAARVGGLLRSSGGTDVVDAHLVVLATQLADDILTADTGDFAALVGSLGRGGPILLRWD